MKLARKRGMSGHWVVTRLIGVFVLGWGVITIYDRLFPGKFGMPDSAAGLGLVRDGASDLRCR